MRNLFKNPALESIDFQSTLFNNELTLACDGLRGLSGEQLSDHENITLVNKIIRKYTGLNASVVPGIYSPSVEIPMVNKNNVLINNFIRNYLNSSDGIRMIENSDKVISGTVDMRTGKVTGVYADIPSTINMPVSAFKDKSFTGEEFAAIILHEIGHLITFYTFMGEVASTNQCLAGIAKGMDGSDVNQREAVLIAAKNKLKLKDFDTKALAKADVKAVHAVVISNQVKQSISLLDRNIYDFSSWEYLADQYAARQGAARPLATALSKIYKGSYNIAFRGSVGFLIMEALKIVLLVLSPVLAVFLFVMDGQGDGTYDLPGARLKRIRNQVIENLKDRNLTKDDVERLNSDVAAIDGCLESINDRRQLISVLQDFLWPSASKDRAFTKLQQELEDLAANDLFAKSAEWRMLA